MYEDNYSGSPFEEHNAQNGTQSAQTQQETISQYGETRRESAHQYGTYDYQYANQNGAGSSASTGANKNARKKSSFGKTLAVILAVAIAAGGLCGAGVYGLSKYAHTKVSRSEDGKSWSFSWSLGDDFGDLFTQKEDKSLTQQAEDSKAAAADEADESRPSPPERIRNRSRERRLRSIRRLQW